MQPTWPQGPPMVPERGAQALTLTALGLTVHMADDLI